MTESGSFENALKRVLVSKEKKTPKATPKPKKKRRSTYVSEAISSSQTMPSAVSQSSKSSYGGQGGMPPFARYSSDMEGGQVDMRDIGKEDEEKAKSVQVKPYPLSTVLDFIASSGESLKNAESMIEVSLRKNDVTLTDAQKKMLKEVHQTIKSSLGNISKAAKSINSITVS